MTDRSYINDVISLLEPRVCVKDDYVMRSGDIGDCMYFVVSGVLEVF